MFSGKQYKLRQDTLGIESDNGERVAVNVPAGDIIEVLSGPRPDDQRMVDVLWGEHTLVMFTDDILRRGDEIRAPLRGRPGVSTPRVESVHAMLAAIPQMKGQALFDSFARGEISIVEFLDLAKRLMEPELIVLAELLKGQAKKAAIGQD